MGRAVIAFNTAELRGLPKLPKTNGCDFCATGTPAWRYPARTVPLGVVVVGELVFRPISLGGWRACQDCSDQVEAGDWPALARRTLRSLDVDLSRAGPGTRVRLLAAFHASHESFRKARSGPREAVS
jgi:hypothetical protein